ncbi:MAG: calcium/sodium antiporter [Lachnospiraceae bacterium]|nr:calcium/sodium antiporter [Lachnospiraceae bacterium]
MIVHILLFILGLILLIKGGDWFVDGATGIAKKFHVPEIIIGATVVSIGTTLPEVLVSATGAATGHGAMAYGNAIGSIICNTALVAAITVAVKPGKINKKSLVIPVIFFFAAAIFYAGNAYVFGEFKRWSGIVLLVTFFVYMFILVKQALKPGNEDMVENEEEGDDKEKAMWLVVVLLVVGAALIAVGANLLVNHGIAIAGALGVPETVIALTFVALGTSLPELVTAITSLAKGHGALSLGNVCGANLFNLVLVSGLSITIGPFKIAAPDFSVMNLGGKEVFSSLVVDTPLMLIVMAILTIPALIKGKLSRWQGIILLVLYAAFTVSQFI